MAEGPESSDAVPLFEKAYHASCPGCEVDRLKRERRGIPYRDLSFIWIVSLCTALPISSLFPFLYFMIRDFHIAKREEDIGFYAGFVGSSFMVGRALTSVFWGVLADRYGRKPVILIGTFSVVVLNTLFGLSTSFWMALCTRFLLGCFNSLLGTIRAYASEVSTEEHHALTLSVVSTSRGMGLIIGPAIGGFFAQPAEKYPGLFSQSSIFGRYPYFLPCLLISIYAAGVFISCWWLPETLHVHESTDGRGSCDEVEISCDSSDTTKHDTEVEEQKTYEENLLKNWPLMSTIIVYCVFSLQEIAYSEVSGVTGIFILLNNAVDIIFSPSTALQPQHQRGAANGISMTAMSISKAFGPACGGALFSWAQRRQVATFLPGAKFSMISRISVLWFPALTLIEQNARTCAASCFRLIS
ncbi:probable peptide/nitrate transporter At3g43790 isoform X5 [Syzygium oleosum]|uniref:probable peptide/nitrate transporter At3g43790 isoform X5 n=1 Tax=Syzygium oleosum TaxID=219896 RepID=UPI0024B90530|nr:probable peptide/nitrate transporter At3g43790 isoform X5 [Syzygium oleosum]